MGALQPLELESALHLGGERQSHGRHGFLWLVELGAYDRKVRVAGDNSAQLLAQLWGNQLANTKKLDPPPARRYLDHFQLVEDIDSIVPVSRTFRLRDERWVRYTVSCCGYEVMTVAVSEEQLRANLYWGRTNLPIVPSRSGIEWHDFHFDVLKAESIGSWYEQPPIVVVPPPSLIFRGRVCPTCECINGSRSQRCHECHSRLDMPAIEVLRNIPA